MSSKHIAFTKSNEKMLPHARAAIHGVVLFLLLGASLCLTAGAGFAGRAEEVSEEDADFARAAASGGIMEVQLGKTAQERASNAEVKEFGRRMQTDHSKANDELKRLAAKKDIKIPSQPAGKHKAVVDKLSKLKREEFDRAYMGIMVDDHKEDIELFERQADKGRDADLRRFAREYLPTLRKHLELAQRTRKQVSRDGK